KNLDVGDTEPRNKERINYLLEGQIHGEIARQCMEEYKKITAESFSNENRVKEREKRVKNKKIWQYTFINIQVGKSFNQNIGDEEEKVLSQYEDKLAKTVESLTRRPVKFETR
ncbi:30026_t:CDS:2, partial [Racocetra persica]